MKMIIKSVLQILSVWSAGLTLAMMISFPLGIFIALTQLSYNAAMRILTP